MGIKEVNILIVNDDCDVHCYHRVGFHKY